MEHTPTVTPGSGAPLDADEIRRILCGPIRRFEERAIRFAMDAPDISLPVAREILDTTIDAHRQGCDDDLAFGPIYAAYLAGYHRDQESFGRFAEAGRLPDSEGAFGDLITDDLCGILWATSSGTMEELLGLADDPALDPYYRDAALRAITIGVWQRAIDYGQARRAFRQRLERWVDSGTPKNENDLLDATFLASHIVDFGTADDLAVLERAYAEGWIDDEFMRPDAWRSRGPTTREEAVDKIGKREGRSYPVDPMTLHSWAVFRRWEAQNAAAVHRKRAAQAQAKARQKEKRRRKDRKKTRRRGKRRK